MSKNYEFDLLVKRSRRQSTALQVRGNQVTILTNYETPAEMIDEILLQNEQWLRNRLAKQDATGFWLWGKRYEIVKTDAAKVDYQLTADSLYIRVRQDSDKYYIFDRIYFEQQERLMAMIKYCVEQVPFKPTKVTIKRMKRSFGICHRDGKISLNLYLAKYLPEFVYMIVYHELCHLQQADHSAKFYRLLEQYCPDYRRIRKESHIIPLRLE